MRRRFDFKKGFWITLCEWMQYEEARKSTVFFLSLLPISKK